MNMQKLFRWTQAYLRAKWGTPKHFHSVGYISVDRLFYGHHSYHSQLQEHLLFPFTITWSSFPLIHNHVTSLWQLHQLLTWKSNTRKVFHVLLHAFYVVQQLKIRRANTLWPASSPRTISKYATDHNLGTDHVNYEKCTGSQTFDSKLWFKNGVFDIILVGTCNIYGKMGMFPHQIKTM